MSPMRQRPFQVRTTCDRLIAFIVSAKRTWPGHQRKAGFDPKADVATRLSEPFQ
jgi:hypothetical protein